MEKENLKTAINQAFSDARLEATLGSSTYGVENWRFNIPALSETFGGSYSRVSGPFDVNFERSFNALSTEDQKEIERYYADMISAISDEWRERFPKAFAIRNSQKLVARS